jgi:tetratricopeptide (TPR) repeat protein
VKHDVLVLNPHPSPPPFDKLRRTGEGTDGLPSPATAGEGQGMGVMWWSFYEGEASFAKFVDEALKYVSGHEIDAARLPTTYDRAQELRRELQSKRVFFVLDGFERQLRAYGRLDAAYQRDGSTDESRDARACVDPIAARLIRDIAAGTTRAKVLITSRLMVRDLEDRAGDPLAGVLYRELKELGRDDALAFMRAQGVTKGTPAEIATVCEAYGNHPLSLRLLSGLIARDTRTPGDIAAAPRHDVHADLVQRQHHVLEQSYNALPDKERTLLSRLAAFRSAMTYDALAIFNEFGDPSTGSGQVSAKFDAALEDLHDWGFIQRETAHNRYDLHPIVRHYCYDRLTDKEGVHTRLRDYFAKIPVPDKDKVKSIEDLAPAIELYHHTARAGRYDEAARLLRDRLVPDPLHYRFGAYQLMIELERALFPDGEDHPPRLKDEGAQPWTLNALGSSYGLSGQPRRAVQLFEQQSALREKAGDKKELAVGLVNLTSRHFELGALAAGERNLRRSIELCHEIRDEFIEANCHMELGRLLVYRGVFDDAESELKAAQDVFAKTPTNLVSTICAYRALRAFLMGKSRATLKAAQEARMLADEVAKKYSPYERDFIRAEWLLGAALVMEGKDLNAAATHLAEALTRCRRINLAELEPDILLAWARWHRARGNPQEAQVNTEEALAIADRCEYRLKQAEIHNFLARLALDEADRRRKTEDGGRAPNASVIGRPSSVSEALAEARRHAEIARERAWCDGPLHCYKPALDEAEKMLKELQ